MVGVVTVTVNYFRDSSSRQIMCDRWPPSLDCRVVSSGCDLQQPVRTVILLIVPTVCCCLWIVFVASRDFAFLPRRGKSLTRTPIRIGVDIVKNIVEKHGCFVLVVN